MFMQEALPFVTTFVETLNKSLEEQELGSGLSRIQKSWLSFCVMAIMITNCVCWAKFERASLGKYSLAALSWMFRYSKIPWQRILQASVRIILSKYSITAGILVADDSEKKRSKITKRIFRVHKLKDKKTGGYIMGQSIILLLLVTPVVTIPVGFAFYMPAPEITQWYKKKEKLKKQGIPKKMRPDRPLTNPNYPTKQELVLSVQPL